MDLHYPDPETLRSILIDYMKSRSRAAADKRMHDMLGQNVKVAEFNLQAITKKQRNEIEERCRLFVGEPITKDLITLIEDVIHKVLQKRYKINLQLLYNATS